MSRKAPSAQARESSARVHLSELLRDQRKGIIELFGREARRLPKARSLPGPALIDHIPELIDRIAEIADAARDAPISAPRPASTREAEIHAHERLREGYDLEEVTAEYALLRQCILRVIDQAPARLHDREIEVLGATIDDAIAVAVESFGRARQRVMRALERVSALALTGLTTLDSLIADFLRAALETPAVDSVAVVLREGQRLRVLATLGFEREVSDEVTLATGEGVAGIVAATRRPLLIAAGELRPDDEVTRASAARAVYSAPMAAGDDLIGVIQLGSRVATAFAEEDKAIFQAMAVRLASVIAEAHHHSRQRAAGIAARVFASATSIDHAAEELLRALGETFDWEVGAYWKADPGASVVRVHSTWAREPEEYWRFLEATKGLTLRRGEGLPGAAWDSGIAEYRRDVARDSNFPRARFGAQEGLHGAVAFPLKHDNAVLGVLEFFGRERRSPSEEHVYTTRMVAEHLGEFVWRLLAQEALVRSEREKAAILESALDAVVGMDASGCVIAWNPAAERTFGYTRDEALGREMDSLLIPERLRDAHRRGLARYLATGTGDYLGKRLELPAMRSDGSEIIVELVIVRLSVAEASPIFNGFLRDITVRKRAEHATAVLADATRVLLASLDEQRIIQDLARIVVPRLADMCVVDLIANGAPASWAVAHRDTQADQWMRELRERHPIPETHPVVAVRKTGKALLHSAVTEELLQSMAADDDALELLHRFDVQSYAVVPLSARGRTLGTLAISTSQPSRRRLAAEDLEVAEELARRASTAIDNARLYAKAQQAVRIREEVLAIVSHDLKNPLNAVGLSAGSLLRSVGTDLRARGQLEVIQRAVGQMQHLIGDLLDVASIEAGRLAIEPAPVAASSVARELFELHAPLAEQKHVALRLELNVEGVTVLCDRERTLQALSNLVGNAIKFCRKGDTIMLEANADGPCVRFSVTDSGPGIAKTDLPRLFDPYWSAPRHAKKGTGLGLYIAKGIVEAQGGRIAATSEPGRTRFEATVPVAPA